MRDSSSDLNEAPLVELATPVPISGDATNWAHGKVVPNHYHSVDQLIYAAVGVVTVETKDGIWVVPPTRGVWVPAQTIHRIKASGDVQLRTLQFSDECTPLELPECRVLQVSPLLRACILRVMEFPVSYEPTSPEGRIAAVILDEFNVADIEPLHLPMPTDRRARRVAVAFSKDLSNRDTCEIWASTVGASERTLDRLFRIETGLTFGKWQQQARLVGALRMLANGQSVTSTSFDVGFKSTSAFIAMFKSVLGKTPSKYFADPC